MLTENELEQIAWRAGRGSHFENSQYVQQVIKEDIPKLIAEIRLLRKQKKALASELRGFINLAASLIDTGHLDYDGYLSGNLINAEQSSLKILKQVGEE